MPKFSAYMRGEKGIQGETGQASLLDGIVDGYSNLPNKSSLIEDKNYVYYVKEEDGIHLYVYKGGSGEDWQHLGIATAGFSTTQYASASTKEWFPGVQPDVTIIPHDNQQTTGLKSFDFHFNIPASQPAGFSTNQLTSVSTLNWNENATVEITPDENSPDYDKSFLFKFGIPHGREAGFSTTQKANATILSWTEDPTVSITTDENSPFYSKVYNFEFGIPQGEPAGFGTLSTEIEILNHLSTATFNITEGGTNKEKDLKFNLGIPAAHPAGFGEITADALDLNWNENPEIFIETDGNDWEKNFTFNFGIPHGRPAGFADEMEVSVTTLSSTSDATVSITPDETTPDYAKKFNFEFGIPNGVPGGFGNISVSTQQVDALTPAQVTITTSGPESAKNFDFLFKIPQGKSSGSAGGYIGTYVSRSFTSTSDSTSTIYWDNNNILHIKNQNNNTIPVYIINNENQNIFSAFKFDKENEEILYYGDTPFEGDIYLIAESAIPEFIIHNVNTVSSSTPVSINAQYIDDDLSQVFLNFSIPRGVGISNIIKDETYISETTNRYKVLYEDGQYSTFDVTKGDKGDKGDQGSEGIGISEIKKTNTEGLIDTYTITYTNGDTYSYNIKNGEKGEPGLGISSITKTNEDELVDTYTITYTDNSTTTFTITNGAQGNIGSPGRGIQNIEYQNTQDSINNYIINYTDGTTSSITTTNGRNALTFSIGEVISLNNNENAYASITTDLQGNVILNLGLPKGSQGIQGNPGIPGNDGPSGPEGPAGNGISSIEKINEQGLQDTYAINYTNGTFDTFTVTNGRDGEGGGGQADNVDWSGIYNNPFFSLAVTEDGTACISTDETAKYSILSLNNNNLVLRTDKWKNSDNNDSNEPFIYYHNKDGLKVGEISIERKNQNVGIKIGTKNNFLKIGNTPYGNCFYELSDPIEFRNSLGATDGIWPVELGGTGVTTIADIMTNLGAVNGIWPIELGGTGATTSTAALTALGAATINHTHNNYLPLTGGTLISSSTTPLHLIIKDETIDKSVIPESDIWPRHLIFRDKDDEDRGYLELYSITTNEQGIQLEARRKVNSNDIYNSLQLSINSEGNRLVKVTEAKAWRIALGANEDGVWGTALIPTLPLNKVGITSGTKTPTTLATGNIYLQYEN